MKNSLLLVAAMSMAMGVAHAGDLCKVNPFTRADAEQGRAAFNSHCALCHQYSMQGRVPGNHEHETPGMNLLSASDLDFLDHGGGAVPPLVGPKFFDQYRNGTLVEFSAKVSSAANTFPPNPPLKMQLPLTYLQISAYVLYRNCGRL